MKHTVVTVTAVAFDGESNSYFETVENDETVENVRQRGLKEMKDYFEDQLMAVVIHVDEFRLPDPVVTERTTEVEPGNVTVQSS